MIESLGLVADKVRNLRDPSSRSNHEQKITELEPDIVVRRKLYLRSGDPSHDDAIQMLKIQFR
jgi:hypothetical protein